MEILTNQLRAVLLAAAKKDVRNYLNGVLVNSRHIVATDGHRMHIAVHGQDWQHGDVIIPREAVELAVKSKAHALQVTAAQIGNVAFSPVCGKFPDYMRVIPQGGVADVGPLEFAVNPDYLRDACKAIELATGTALANLCMVGGALTWGNGVFQAVIVPLRGTQKTGPLTSLQKLK